jgi:hypothetical protein
VSVLVTPEDIATMRRMVALHERTGAIYAGDPATGAIARVHPGIRKSPIIHIHVRAERPRERPRERRARRSSKSSRGSPDDPHELEVIPVSAFRAELRRALGAA